MGWTWQKASHYYPNGNIDRKAECDCPPKSIIALLTPTDNEYALLWRKRCLDTHSSKAHLAKLPIGAVIEFSRNGKTVRLEKHEAAYQFKKPFWWNGSNYYPKKYIPRTYNIIKEAV